jgi:hypothetical protein
MTKARAVKGSAVIYKCLSGCSFTSSNKGNHRAHLNSISHMIANRIKNSASCKRCDDGEEYDGRHLNYHFLATDKNSFDCFIDTLMNERLKDFTLDDNQRLQAHEWKGKGFLD